MAQDLYADQVANIREKLARLQEEKVESYDDLANTITENYNEKIKGYEDKWKAVADAGGEELAGMVGAKGIYSGGKKLLDLYRGRKERTKAQREKQQKDEVGEDDDFDEDAEPLDGDVARAVAGDDDSPIDFYNEDGEKYFNGTQADHDEHYTADGELKDPSNIPEGHISNETEPETEDEEEDFQEDAQPVQDAQPQTQQDDPLDLDDEDVDQLFDAPSLDEGDLGADAVADTSEEPFDQLVARFQQQRRLQPSDDVADQPTNVAPDDVPQGARPRPPEIDEADPFQPAQGARVRPTEVQGSPQTSDPEVADQNVDPFNDPRARRQVRPTETGGEPEPIGGGQEGLSEVGGEGSSLLERAGQKAFTSLAKRGQSIREGFGAVKNFFSPSGGSGATAGAETGAEVGAEAGAEAGVEALAGLGTADAVLGAIPVVGELALLVSGVVGLGEGIYHLFHPDKKPPPPPTASPVTAPHALTQSYALALPSVDNAVDRQASVGTF